MDTVDITAAEPKYKRLRNMRKCGKVIVMEIR